MINAPSKLFVLIPVVVNQAELKKYKGREDKGGGGKIFYLTLKWVYLAGNISSNGTDLGTSICTFDFWIATKWDLLEPKHSILL